MIASANLWNPFFNLQLPEHMPIRIATFFKGDKVIWTIILLLAVFSVFAVYSSTNMLAYTQQSGRTEYYLLKHGVFIIGGLAITWVFSHFNYANFGRIARPLLYITIPLLLFTLLFGSDVNEARRWITIPLISITFQSSDLAKLALMLYVARQLATLQDQPINLRTLGWPVLAPVILTCGLIAPANLSTALLLFGSVAVLLFVGRLELKAIGQLAGAGILLFGFIVLLGLALPETTRVSVWSNRITSFLEDSEELYQVQQAKIAIANGGLLGEGPGNSYQRNVLPSGYSDYIYAIFIEEYGLMGGLFLLILYLVFFWRTIRIVTLCDRAFGSLLVMGMSLLIVLQALINMAVAVDLLPVTGVTLPFMSMGGTSLLFFSMGAGMILSVSRVVEKRSSAQDNVILPNANPMPA